MHAAVLHAIGEPLRLEEVAEPEAGPGEVLVRTKACGICGTDLHIVDGWGYVPRLPHILGHEPAGVVAAVGAGVSDFQAGDRVVPNIFFTCGNCRCCRTNRETLCLSLKGILGVLTYPGAYAGYFKIPARQLFHLPEAISFEEGGLIADAVVCAVHAVYDRARVRLHDLTLVLGVGGVGSTVLQVARAAGARVIALDRGETRVELALQLGAMAAIDVDRDDVAARIRTLTDGLGVDVAVDCVGSAGTLSTAVRSLRRGGRLVILGYTQEAYPLDPREVAVNELEVVGVRSGGRQNTAQAIELVAQGKVKPVIGARFPLQEANAALARLREGNVLGRVVLQVE
jgi:propanol-preferring alcohol dehydrogenase